MKKLFVLTVFLVAIFRTASAEECRTDIKEEDTYNELNAIFKCLSKRIDALEAEIKTIRNARAKDTANTQLSHDEKCKSKQDQDGISFCLEHLSISTDKKVVSAIANIKNTTDKQAIMALIAPAASITDENANIATIFYINGLYACFNVKELTTSGMCYNNRTMTDLTILNPGVAYKIIMRFRGDNNTDINGNSMSLNAQVMLLIKEQDKYEDKKAGYKNINIPVSMTNIIPDN